MAGLLCCQGTGMALVVGITGGVATGKTTVLELFESLGAETLSADKVARDILAKGAPAHAQVVSRFGKQVLAPDGEIDRRALGEIVFGDPQARQDLNDITHPRIIRVLEQGIAAFRKRRKSQAAVLAVEIPLLFERGLESMVDTVVAVAAEQQTQMNRLTSVWDLSAEQALLRIRAQMPIEEKVGRADHVIWNDGDLDSLKRSVRRIYGEILLL